MTKICCKINLLLQVGSGGASRPSFLGPTKVQELKVPKSTFFFLHEYMDEKIMSRVLVGFDGHGFFERLLHKSPKGAKNTQSIMSLTVNALVVPVDSLSPLSTGSTVRFESCPENKYRFSTT